MKGELKVILLEKGKAKLSGDRSEIVADLTVLFKVIDEKFKEETFNVISTALLMAQKTSDRNTDIN